MTIWRSATFRRNPSWILTFTISRLGIIREGLKTIVGPDTSSSYDFEPIIRTGAPFCFPPEAIRRSGSHTSWLCRSYINTVVTVLERDTSNEDIADLVELHWRSCLRMGRYTYLPINKCSEGHWRTSSLYHALRNCWAVDRTWILYWQVGRVASSPSNWLRFGTMMFISLSD